VHPPLEKLWEFRARGDIESSPALAYGLVFFGSKDKHVYAVDASTGESRWTFKTGKAVITTPVVADGVVYAASEDKHLYALDAQTGDKRWSFSPGKEISATPAAGQGMVFFGCKDKQVYALDVQTGQPRWTFSTEYKDHSPPVIIRDKVLITGRKGTKGRLYAIDAAKGDLVWEEDDRLGIPAPVAASNTVMSRSSDHQLYGTVLQDGASKGRTIPDRFYHAIISQNFLYISLMGPFALYGFDLSHRVSDGWDFGFMPWPGVPSVPAVSGDFAFVTAQNAKTLYGFRISKFTKRWQYEFKDVLKMPTGAPVIADGRLFVVTDKGKLHAFKGTDDPKFTQRMELILGTITKEPTFKARLHQKTTRWPNCCCLCCGPAETHFTLRSTAGQITLEISGVPYCNACKQKVTKTFGGEKPGVVIDQESLRTLAFRNEKYWAMFMEANHLR
jgi:serine/threonine-protein kinase